MLTQQERTSTYVLVRGHYVNKPKSSAAADVAAATTAATIAATAVGHTRRGSASLYARLVGLTFTSTPFVLVRTRTAVLDFCCMFPDDSHLENRHNNLETRNLQSEMFNRAYRSRPLLLLYDIYGRASPAAK